MPTVVAERNYLDELRSILFSEVRADRSLRLAGYEVYRFGGQDFTDNRIEGVLIDFFDRLFSRHGINI